MPRGIYVECVEYVAGIRDIASIARDDAAHGKKRNSSRARSPIIVGANSRQASFFWIPSTARPANRGNDTDSSTIPRGWTIRANRSNRFHFACLSSVEIGHRRMFS